MFLDLKSVLQGYVGQFHFGDSDRQEPLIDRNRLIFDLKHVTNVNEKYFQISIAMASVVFLLGCALVLIYREDTKAITAIFSVSGISIASAALSMVKFWRQKVMTDTLLILIGHMPDKDIKGTIKVLFDTIRK
jgi:hypothetical protein